MKQFNLSEKIEEGNALKTQIPCFDYIPSKNVKEFIKRLKEDFEGEFSDMLVSDIMQIIRKRAGEELI